MALSSQTQWAEGAPLSTLLLSAASPDVVLLPGNLGALGGMLRGQLVVCSAALPPDLVAALLAVGARAVVCGVAGSSSIQQAALDECTAFFAAFYDALLAGRPVADSLQQAEQRCPALCGAFSLCTA